MASLDQFTKELIVKRLATYTSPVEIQKELKMEHNVEANIDQIVYYNPETKNGAKLASKWKELFHYTRDEYKDKVISHDVTHQGFRLGMLQRIVMRNIGKDDGKAMEALEQVAKEMGGHYLTKIDDSGKGGDINLFLTQVNAKLEQHINKDK